MARKPKTGATTGAAPEAAARPMELVVRRGAIRRFDKLKTKSADLPVVVMWDRRQGDRRSGAPAAGVERRGPDRRQKPPFTWELADFVVVGKYPTDDDETPPKAS